MERKIIKVGNSLGVIIPSPLLEELGVTYQDVVDLEYSKQLNAIVIRNKKTTLPNDHLEQVVRSIVEETLRVRGL